ncbi:unnamed protein product [Caenorhabditis brenneri]
MLDELSIEYFGEENKEKYAKVYGPEPKGADDVSSGYSRRPALTINDIPPRKSEGSSDLDRSYCISQVLEDRRSDARALAVTESGVLISGGRDDKVTWWGKKGGKYSKTLTFDQPRRLAIKSIAYVDMDDGWKLFVGRKDGTIAVYASGSQEPVAVFKEHTQNVCCLHINQKGTHLLSGSWDANVMIFPITEINKSSFTVHRCVGHSAHVWALDSFPENPDVYLSASADKTIRLWHGNETTATFSGHTSTVRALAVLSNEHFLSAGHDGHIIHWNVSSRHMLGKFSTNSHDFIYSMTLSDSHILTTGENGTLEFWTMDTQTDGTITILSEEVLMLPAGTTWDAKVLPNSDIAVSGSDGRLYVLSNDSTRQASDEIKEAFAAKVAAKLEAMMDSEPEVSDEVVKIKVDVDDRPTQLELQYRKGTDPGLCAQEFIQENHLPMHYLEEITKFIKDRVPEARAYDVKTGKKVRIDGEEYDYALSVSLPNGEEMKMPFNVNESPEFAAQRFVERKGHPAVVIPVLARMISQEMDKVSRGGGGSGYEDPFTGRENHAVPLSSMKQDKKRPRGALIPVPEYYLIKRFGKVSVARLKELNGKQDAFQLSTDQINCLEELFHPATTSKYSSDVAQSAFDTALQWPVEHLAPVLDFFRVALTHESLNTYFCTGERGQDLVMKIIAILVSDPDKMVLKVMVCRCIGNAFAHPAGRSLFASYELSTLAPLVIRQLLNEEQMLQMSAATALANWSLALLKQSETVEQLGPKEDLLRALITGIEAVDSFGFVSEDALSRLLQAIVTIMWGDSSVIQLAKNRNMAAIAARLKDATQNEMTKSMARDVVEMTHAD